MILACCCLSAATFEALIGFCARLGVSGIGEREANAVAATRTPNAPVPPKRTRYLFTGALPREMHRAGRTWSRSGALRQGGERRCSSCRRREAHGAKARSPARGGSARCPRTSTRRSQEGRREGRR